MPVSRLYFGVTNLGLSLRLISNYSFNPLPCAVHKSAKIGVLGIVDSKQKLSFSIEGEGGMRGLE
jgi:hypothetical protein